jgi:uncharacterized integral membrane protein
MSGQRSRRGNVLVGLILIFLGMLFFLDEMDLGGFSNLIGKWWPLILVIIAIYQLSSPAGRRSTGPYILLALGLVFQSIELDYFEWNIVWPLVLVLIGLRILFGPSFPWIRRTGKPISSENSVSSTAILGGSEHTITSQQFQGGQATALFGGVDIDLRQARIEGTEATLSVTAIFGGVDIIVPAGWQVVVRGTPIMGSLENKVGSAEGQDRPTVWIDAFVFCGGVEVKN